MVEGSDFRVEGWGLKACRVEPEVDWASSSWAACFERLASSNCLAVCSSFCGWGLMMKKRAGTHRQTRPDCDLCFQVKDLNLSKLFSLRSDAVQLWTRLRLL